MFDEQKIIFMKQRLAYLASSRLFLIAIVLLLCSFSSISMAETLRLLVWEGYAPETHRTRFIDMVKEKYGIDLEMEVTYISSDDEFFPALRDGTADIISPVHSLIKDKRFRFIDHNLILPLNLENIPNYNNILPSLQQPEYCSQDGNVYCAPIARGPYGLAYNTELVKDPPQSWNILWDPKYKNQYTLGKETYVENVNLTALAMGMDRKNMSNYRALNTPEFQDKLTELVVNAHSLWEGVDKAEDLKGLALAAVWGTSLVELEKQGDIWKMAEPKEGTPAWVDNLLLGDSLKDKPQLKQIAEEWLNYVLSDDFQLYLTREILWPTVSTTVKAKMTPEEIERFHLEEPEYFGKHRILLQLIGKRDRDGIKRLWEKALKMRD